MSSDSIIAVIDSRIWLPTGLPKRFLSDLRRRFKHSNPEFHKKKASGFSTWGIDRHLETMDYRTDKLGERPTLPRGGTGQLREVCDSWGFSLKWIDRRTSSPVKFPKFVIKDDPELEPYYYQHEAVETALQKQQGICRAPTGSGKTVAALLFLYRAQERALIIMRDGNLLKQWYEVIQKTLGLGKKDIGIIRSGRKYFPGRPIVLALQQSLYSNEAKRTVELVESEDFGVVVIDESQTVASKTFIEVVDIIPAKYRIGFSADERRRDKKEFLTYDEMGPVIHEVSTQELEEFGAIHPVKIRVIETKFKADWYRNAETAERDFTRLIEEMIDDEGRNELALWWLHRIMEIGETPLLGFTHRKEHARYLAIEELNQRGIPCGLFLGGQGNASRFALDLIELRKGDLKVGIGTFQAIGQGHDIPIIRAGFCLTPISERNPQFFGQVKGRICRTSETKDAATLYYLWDREVFPDQLKTLNRWNRGNVELFHGGTWVSVSRVR